MDSAVGRRRRADDALDVDRFCNTLRGPLTVSEPIRFMTHLIRYDLFEPSTCGNIFPLPGCTGSGAWVESAYNSMK